MPTSLESIWEPSRLESGCRTVSQTLGHHIDHREVDEGLSGFGKILVVFAQTTVLPNQARIRSASS